MKNISRIRFNFLKESEPVLIAGPCSAESRDQLLETAIKVAETGVRIFRAGVWKPRTKPGNFEGAGDCALEWLAEVKRVTSMLTMCEVASAEHVKKAVETGVDIFWIGARTTADPFAVQEIADSLGDTEIPVFVKNPVNPDMDLWIGAIERLQNAGVKHIGAIHRGFSSFGEKLYRNDPIWQIPIELKRKYPEITLLCDPSHLGGKREYVSEIGNKAYELGFDGLMIETHCNPDCALSDSAQQITPEELKCLLKSLVKRENTSVSDALTLMRQEIDDIDSQILTLLSKRMELSGRIGAHKKASNMPVLQNGRYQHILDDRAEKGASLGLSKDFVETIMKDIHEESVKRQL